MSLVFKLINLTATLIVHACYQFRLNLIIPMNAFGVLIVNSELSSDFDPLVNF